MAVWLEIKLLVRTCLPGVHHKEVAIGYHSQSSPDLYVFSRASPSPHYEGGMATLAWPCWPSRGSHAHAKHVARLGRGRDGLSVAPATRMRCTPCRTVGKKELTQRPPAGIVPGCDSAMTSRFPRGRPCVRGLGVGPAAARLMPRRRTSGSRTCLWQRPVRAEPAAAEGRPSCSTVGARKPGCTAPPRRRAATGPACKAGGVFCEEMAQDGKSQNQP